MKVQNSLRLGCQTHQNMLSYYMAFLSPLSLSLSLFPSSPSLSLSHLLSFPLPLFTLPPSYSRFVTKETVLDYVDSDQLLERFGGTDPWQYDYQAEKRRLVEEAEKVWKGKNLVEEEEDSEVEELSLDHQDSLVNGDMSDPLLVDVSTSGSGQSTEHPQSQLLGAEEVDGDGEKKQVRRPHLRWIASFVP